jgi:hypothetical protein
MLTRSAWAGMQRWGAALWSGDTSSHWGSLKVSVQAGLNTQLSGIAWWTTDIGGYSGGDPSSPEFRELIVRWFEFGVSPRMPTRPGVLIYGVAFSIVDLWSEHAGLVVLLMARPLSVIYSKTTAHTCRSHAHCSDSTARATQSRGCLETRHLLSCRKLLHRYG